MGQISDNEKITRRIKSEIVARAKRQLEEQPRAPLELRGYVTALMDMLGCVDLFNRSGVTFIREAQIAAEMGIIRGASQVSLIHEDRPDFELHFEGYTELYELAEADRLDRERGRQYRAIAEAGCPIYHVPVEEWATATQAADSINAIAEKKSQRAQDLAANGTPYPLNTRLLIYVNLSDYGANTGEIEGIFPSAVDPARKWFSTICLLWKNKLYEV